MKTMEIYKNYGCLAAEKMCVYTYGGEHHTAVTSEKTVVKIPDGWEADEIPHGEMTLKAPWGWTYNPNEVLTGNKEPKFVAYDKDRVRHDYVLEEIQ